MITYAVLWIFYVGFGLLLVTAVTALASRCKSLLWRRFWPIVAALLVSLPILGGGLFGYTLLKNNFQPKWLFWYCFSEIIIYTLGVIMILIRGLRGSSGEQQRAKTWPRAWPAALAGASFFVFTTTLNIADMRVMGRLADIKHSAGAKIQDRLPAKLPKSLNAHYIYEEAVQAFMSEKELPKWLEKSGRPDFDVSSPEIQDFIAEHKDVLEIIRKAKSTPGYNPPVDTSLYVGSPIPNYRLYRIVADLISVYARSIAEKGDISGALNELAAIERMADHLRSCPQLISVMVSQRLAFIRYKALEYILAHTSHLSGELMPLPVNSHSSIREDFVSFLRMEAYGFMQGFAANISLSDFSDMFSLIEIPDYPTFCPTFSAQCYRVFCGPSEIKALMESYVDRMTKEAESYEELKANLKSLSDAVESGEMGIMTTLLVPNYTFYLSRATTSDVYRGLCDLALAMSGYRAQNNTYPGTLEELIPEYIDRIPVDPYDGKPLKMRSVDGGLDLYSVGSEKEEDKQGKVDAIHFYLGKEAYEKFRVKPVREEKLKKAQGKKQGS